MFGITKEDIKRFTVIEQAGLTVKQAFTVIKKADELDCITPVQLYDLYENSRGNNHENYSRACGSVVAIEDGVSPESVC